MDEIFKSTHKKQVEIPWMNIQKPTLENIKQQQVEIPWTNKHVQKSPQGKRLRRERDYHKFPQQLKFHSGFWNSNSILVVVLYFD